MSKPLDRQAIAEAMQAAGRKALTGTREERSGVFKPAARKPVVFGVAEGSFNAPADIHADDDLIADMFIKGAAKPKKR